MSSGLNPLPFPNRLMRYTTPQPEESRHNRLYKEACALIEGLILLGNEPPGELDPAGRQRLEQAIPLFEEVVRINPGNWAAMWLLGKVHQRLAEYRRGLEWFSRAHRIKPDQPDVAREAAIAAMDAGLPQEAISFCERAIQADPDDPGLRANLALALLFSGRPEEARPVVEEALRRDPNDGITAHIGQLINEVLSGSRPCPHHVRELQ
ncbi:MAG: tetratricopeptide repeat protein [Gemmataceae bacterium]|nr:tetratricopeptide repeat protein [Gemmataceae bacterium]